MSQPASSTSNTCRVYGELNRAQDEIDKNLASGVASLTLDFSTCTFVTVEGLEWLEELLMRADSQQAKVTFINVSPPVYKVFKVAHVDSISRACGSPSSVAPGAAVC